MAKTLSELGLTAKGAREATISGLAVDSREVRADMLFAALPGVNVHGGEFIQYALRMGATAILTDREGARIAAVEIAEHDPVMVIVEDPRQALAYAAALWFGRQPDAMVAVTGTNGKTSVANFTRQIWQLMGHRAINLGTTGVEGDWETSSPNTTPEPITLHKMLYDGSVNGVTHAAMEASSHGLEQRRMDGVRLLAAGFTNFTQDHLDYHETFEAYFAAKAGLFTRVLSEDGVAVVNIDDSKGMEIETLCAERGIDVMRVGRSDAADLRILGQRFDATGQDLRIDFVGNIYQVRLELIGGFQAENVMVAAGLVMACGGDPEEVFSCLPELTGVRGRMQRAAMRKNGAAVFVDYAHTPDAVATAIKALRPHVMGRVVAVIGAGGDRDTTKRPLMGQAAAEAADVVFVTDDNPRSEDPADIRAAVLQGAPDAIEVADRSEAILRAVDALQPGDALLLCGKGHETGQIVGDVVYPFDDVEQASISVAALDGTL
ncbi:UDP-N-acetylmuramoyl-L-alanyl-D-glutamate--2,6-diaminopimelate ligase [Pacificibacter marinus]|uniref:UDP-N-acetylmuramoyl-L-alanyl-D-glutamate--2,6-diaminopimelate ligase n=1 Tax=Pacificibacter marinus TaxID=658057 RepID=A0A1Y5SI73_9RHOB|nr:UDP-N-acetylmuramoyl-L-alanyl-D-glutamate--2,6-diaminopimelate ligase [Pacificibacter marinus]SEK62417.1 UDP-N-acetylmuramoylalanyl-D-glutamate--2,6-diaminopimelate ligase [Pacificibacter marinus]SLN41082.1 UDP-N-acetylmuramoyl-L-alanyl-D-glutamate--2, 6-diaminopimelate ligase [Pacificibacter marinus]